MVVESHLSRAVALLVATFGIGWLAVISRPEGVLGSEMWPVGLTVAVLLTLPRRYAAGGWAATLWPARRPSRWGRMEVESAPDQGTSVHVRVPLARSGASSADGNVKTSTIVGVSDT